MLTEKSTDKVQRRAALSTAQVDTERREMPSTEERPTHRRKVSFDDEVSMDTDELLGLICVYVDDFLAIAPDGPIRDALIRALTSL